jgi:hypothetical protein
VTRAGTDECPIGVLRRCHDPVGTVRPCPATLRGRVEVSERRQNSLASRPFLEFRTGREGKK